MFIIGNLLGSIFWGGVIAILVTLAVYAVCKQLGRADSLLTWGVLAVLLLFGGAQCTMMVGAMYAKGYVDDVSGYANNLLPEKSAAQDAVSDFQRIRQQIEEQFPLSKSVFKRINTDDIQEYTASGHSVVEFIADEMKSTINYYILRRVAWLLGVVLIALVGILMLNKPRDYTIDINNLDSIY